MAGVYTDKRDASHRTSFVNRINGGSTNVWPDVTPATDSITSYRDGAGSRGSLSNAEIFSTFRDEYSFLKSDFDTGHELTLTKYTRKDNIPKGLSLPWLDLSFGRNRSGVISGSFRLDPPIVNLSPLSYWGTISGANVTSYGARAIQRTVPTKPFVSLPAFLGELFRDGKPRVFGQELKDVRRVRDLPKASAKEYLGGQFGAVPYYKDLLKLAQAVLDSRKIIAQFERDSGRGVRRQMSFPEQKSTSTLFEGTTSTAVWSPSSDISYSFPEYYGQTVPKTVSRKYKVTETKVERYWFSGQYVYYLPHLSDTLDSKLTYYEDMANHLLGMRVTADTIWQLTPWSWLIDWWADLSTYTGNAAAFNNDKLVLRYGYLMRTQKVTRDFTVFDPNFQYWKPNTMKSTYTVTRKERFRSTPYGFGLNPDSFSTRQWTVLGALGFTKGPRTIR